jgi:hypothetical protein
LLKVNDSHAPLGSDVRRRHLDECIHEERAQEQIRRVGIIGDISLVTRDPHSVLYCSNSCTACSGCQSPATTLRLDFLEGSFTSLSHNLLTRNRFQSRLSPRSFHFLRDTKRKRIANDEHGVRQQKRPEAVSSGSPRLHDRPAKCSKKLMCALTHRP